MGLAWVLLLLVATSETPSSRTMIGTLIDDAPEVVDVVDVEGLDGLDQHERAQSFLARSTGRTFPHHWSIMDRHVGRLHVGEAERCGVEVGAGRSTTLHLNATWNGEGAPTGTSSTSQVAPTGVPSARSRRPSHDTQWNLTSDEAGLLVCVVVAEEGARANSAFRIHPQRTCRVVDRKRTQTAVLKPAFHALPSQRGHHVAETHSAEAPRIGLTSLVPPTCRRAWPLTRTAGT